MCGVWIAIGVSLVGSSIVPAIHLLIPIHTLEVFVVCSLLGFWSVGILAPRSFEVPLMPQPFALLHHVAVEGVVEAVPGVVPPVYMRVVSTPVAK